MKSNESSTENYGEGDDKNLVKIKGKIAQMALKVAKFVYLALVKIEITKMALTTLFTLAPPAGSRARLACGLARSVTSA